MRAPSQANDIHTVRYVQDQVDRVMAAAEAVCRDRTHMADMIAEAATPAEFVQQCASHPPLGVQQQQVSAGSNVL